MALTVGETVDIWLADEPEQGVVERYLIDEIGARVGVVITLADGSSVQIMDEEFESTTLH